ncbi:hypothetical protein ACFSSA_14070 [Luteolibacter algae]|uniref:Transporter n=1 Tax=Luteolibacter algae TaxID=454151 RepID=A0ABW5DCZ5_9BACT
MKNQYHRNFLQSAVFTAALSGSVALAGPMESAPAAPMEIADTDVVSGSFNLDFNSHFFSYGNDVWNDGDDAFSMGLYPSAELAFALPAGFTATLGIWAEIHDKDRPNTTATLGGDILEVDLWYGLSYTYEKFTVGVTYQNWFYGNDTEDILDISLSYDTFLSPSLTIHNRLDAGAAGPAGGDEGTILVLGLEHGIEAGPVSISFPFSLAYFVDDGYHAASGDSGIGFASIGAQASLPLNSIIGDAYGDWSLNAGVTYYLTDDDVIGQGVNTEDSFFATNIGLGLSF